MRPPRPLADLCTFRAATPGDAAAITCLIQASNRAAIGEADFAEADLTAEWAMDRFDLAHNTIVAQARDGAILGYAWCFDRDPARDYDGDVYVDPAHADAGLEVALLERIERQAAGHARTSGLRASPAPMLHLPAWEHVERARRRLTDHGYEEIRHYFRMEALLEAPVDLPPAPAGITIRTCRKGEDERHFCAVLHEAFRDHFRSSRMKEQDWIRRHTVTDFYRPELWFLALEAAQPVGALVTFFYEDLGWIDELGVLESHRGRGLGQVLLLNAFEAIRRAGQPRIALGVDAANATGATRLYERCGMRVAQRTVLYRKALEGS